MGWRKNRELTQKIEALIAIEEVASTTFETTFARHLEGIHDGIFSFGVDSLHKYKSETTHYVDAVRVSLYCSSFPAVHDELMVWIHTINLIVEDLAHVLYAIRDQKIEPSSGIELQFRELLKCVGTGLHQTVALCRHFVSRKVITKNIADSIEQIERSKAASEVALDSLVAVLFAIECDSGEKLIQSKLATQVGLVSSRCVQLAHHIEILLLAENE